MALFLFRFFPALLPLLVYLAWLFVVRRRAKKAGAPLPRFRDGNIYWLVMASLGMAVLSFVFLVFSVIGH